MSLQKVVRTVHIKLDLARLQHRVVDVLVTDLAKFFDIMAQDVHPIVGPQVGLGDAGHPATQSLASGRGLPGPVPS